MLDTWCDAVVVGGGPIGARVAREIANAGFRVVILERHDNVGQPIQCSGLVTSRTLEVADLDSAMAFNALTGAVIHAPSGSSYLIGGDRVHAYVLDRSQFDQGIMSQALNAGAQLQTNMRVVAIERTSGGQPRVIAENCGAVRGFKTRLIIGADGPRSLVASTFQLPLPPEMIRARGADVRLQRRLSEDHVQIFVGQRYAPGFFAWAIPLGGDHYRIGWGSSKALNGIDPLNALKSDYPDIFGRTEILSQTGGLIPIGLRSRTVGDCVMVVGDAAGQAKSTSGGGLYTGLTAAEHCGRVAVAALAEGNTSEARLRTYERDWREDVGRELRRGLALQRSYSNLSDSELEWGLRLLRLPGVSYLVNRYGDIDFPSRLAGPALQAVPMLSRLLNGSSDLFHETQVDRESNSSPSGVSV